MGILVRMLPVGVRFVGLGWLVGGVRGSVVAVRLLPAPVTLMGIVAAMLAEEGFLDVIVAVIPCRVLTAARTSTSNFVTF